MSKKSKTIGTYVYAINFSPSIPEVILKCSTHCINGHSQLTIGSY